MTKDKKELVVLIHGVLNTTKRMAGLEKYLSDAGYEVYNVDYPSTKHSIRKLTEIVSNLIEKKNPQQYEAVHFVGFSMGGLITRMLLNQHKFNNLGRVIFIGSPHLGSEVADFVVKIPLLAKFFGPALNEMTTDCSLIKKMLGEPHYQFATIAGNRSYDLLGMLLIKGPHDGRVSLRSSLLNGSQDRLILPFAHLEMLRKKGLWQEVLHYIKHGKFIA